jgi:signal transduction histidine kinase/DNA-binding response OmpR family regulator/tetratricopeptide (TPR) repeat protein
MKRSFLLLFLFFPLLCPGQQKERAKLDSLLRELSSAKYRGLNDTNKVDLLYRTSIAYRIFDTDSLGYYAKQGLELSGKLNYRHGQGVGLLYTALANYYEYNKALDQCHRALKIFEELGDDRMVGMTLGTIGGIYFNIERYPQALEYFKKGLAIAEKAGNEQVIADANQSVAAAYINFHDFKKALEHQLIATDYYEQTQQQHKMVSAYINLGICYAAFRKYNLALAYSDKSIRLVRSFGRESGNLASALSEAGWLYYLTAIDSTTILRPDSLLPASRSACLKKAIQYYNEAKQVSLTAGFVPVEITKRLSAAYAASGEHARALDLYKEYITLRDSDLTTNSKLGIAALEVKRETELKEKQIEINRIQKANEVVERIFFAVSALLLCVVTFLIWRNYKKQKLTTSRLGEEKAKLEAANADLAAEKDRSDELAAELRESLVQKEALAAQLSLAADMKTRFLANISHELRTPVTLLTGMLELMKDNKSTDNKNSSNGIDRLDVAYNNSRKLQYMVEEILDLSRLDTSEAKLKTETRDIVPVLKRMIFVFESFIEKEQLRLSYTEHDVEGIHISVDENMLEKIVNNLVYNAIKFNERGGWIRVNLLTSADRRQFIFTINNSGSIIRPEDLPHIFDRFYQANTTAVRAEGVGIGLSLVKEFTNLMNGTVEVTSREGAGTTFTLQFPVVAEKPSEVPSGSFTEELPVQHWEHFPRRQNVLLVEDNDEMRFYLREVLGDRVDLAEATNGVEALSWLSANKTDLIISDMMMPQMGGEEFVAHLKSNDVYKRIPVITLTALADAGSKLNMLRLGIDDYLVKPFNATELRVRVYNLLYYLDERRQFMALPAEQDDIVLDSKESEEFRKKVSSFVLARMKTIDVSVYDLAYELSMSERQLYRLSKKLTGYTPAQLIKEVRLQKAYELLIGGTINKVDDVSKQVGFEDSNYFSRQFFGRFGKRPTEFL